MVRTSAQRRAHIWLGHAILESRDDTRLPTDPATSAKPIPTTTISRR